MRRETTENYLQKSLTENGSDPSASILTLSHRAGAFLFAYVVMVVIEGLPLFCLELHIGNHFKKSVSGSMRVSKLWL